MALSNFGKIVLLFFGPTFGPSMVGPQFVQKVHSYFFFSIEAFP
jgi:hypothetical protein